MSSTHHESAGEPAADGDEYVVRWFRSGDEAGIRSLFAAELDRERSRAYFDWKYRDDPYLSHVPVTVAERDGEVVGVQAYVPVPLRAGDRTLLALQPVDAVVARDHRRNGLYTRMTETAIARYTDGDPALFFNYPSPGALRAQERLGWHSLGTLPVRYRVHRPSRFLDSSGGGRGLRALGRAADGLARTAYDLVDRVAPAGDAYRVTRHESVPAGSLAALYERRIPDRLHVHREARFYAWWLSNPAAEYTTYLATSGESPVAALVAKRHPGGVLQLRDVVPVAPAASTSALARLVSVALADAPDVAVVKSVGATLPDPLLRRFGFVSDAAPGLDGATTPLRMAVRPLASGAEDSPGGADAAESEPVAVDGVPDPTLTDRSAWLPTFLEVDRD